MRLWRAHSLDHPGDECNPTASVTRFTPVFTSGGRRLAYVYAGESEEVAIAETVLHDIPRRGAPAVIPAAKLESMALSEVRLRRAVSVIDLTGLGLKRIDQTQEELIATLADEYPRTARVAQDLLDAIPAVEGILYPSNQFATGRCAVLYRRGRKRNPFERLQSLPLVAGRGREIVDLACDAAGVTVVQ
jgi:RES domain